MAYGTSVVGSDVDVRGIFAQSRSEFLALTSPPALVADERHDTVYYSLRRTIELLAAANPSVLELLFMPDDCVRRVGEPMRLLIARRALFVTRQCIDTHAGYAFSQIKKAKGQNKWINQPQPEAPPSKEDFCYVLSRESLTAAEGMPARPVAARDSGIDLARCHAARLEHARDVFRLYDYGADARGVFRGDAIALSSIPLADESPRFVGLLLYNEGAWRQAMIDHGHYWTWRAERNEARWRQQETGELDYDAKNLMHTIRLLLSARAIARRGVPTVRFEGEERQRLLDVRAGRFTYAEVIAMAEEIKAECEALRDRAALPERCDARAAEELLRQLTEVWEQTCP
jgi:predicted nucleotidyltransferase